MFDLTPVQLFNTITNIISMLLMVPVLFTVIGYKKRAQRRAFDLEHRLDRLLLLTSEMYHKEKARPLDQENTAVGPTAETFRTQITSRV